MEPATFRFVAQGLNELRHRVPLPSEGPHILDASVHSLFARDFWAPALKPVTYCYCVAISNQYFLTFWRRNYYFLYILAHSVHKMWIQQEPNALELWNKLYFEGKKRRVYTRFKIFSTYICWINI